VELVPFVSALTAMRLTARCRGPNDRSDCTNHCTTGGSDARITPLVTVVTADGELSRVKTKCAGGADATH